jgi:hypothetical protein
VYEVDHTGQAVVRGGKDGGATVSLFQGASVHAEAEMVVSITFRGFRETISHTTILMRYTASNQGCGSLYQDQLPQDDVAAEIKRRLAVLTP